MVAGWMSLLPHPSKFEVWFTLVHYTCAVCFFSPWRVDFLMVPQFLLAVQIYAIRLISISKLPVVNDCVYVPCVQYMLPGRGSCPHLQDSAKYMEIDV